MEEVFNITVDLHGDGRNYTLNVIPGPESWKLIILDGVDLGTITNDGDNCWYWMDGNLDEDVAARIGNAIEKHYM